MSFEPIPSLGCRYEIDQRGTVRNAKTKKPLKKYYWHNTQFCIFHFIGGYVKRSISTLLWEVHGIEPKNFSVIGATVSKNNETYHFDSRIKAARFIADKEFYHVSSVQKRMAKREPDIYGWKITYHEPEPRIFKPHRADYKRKGENSNESNRI